VAILEREDRELAEKILRTHKNVKSVLIKKSGRKGRFRLYEFKLFLGDSDTEVVHREYGMRFKLDPKKVYFSPREDTERQRIASFVKEGESVLVLFAGVAPYAIAIARKVRNCRIFCVEINKQACKYARENVKLNRVEGKVFVICADAGKIQFRKKFDRIVMPLPESAIDFLPAAVKHAKKGSIIHLYSISSGENLFSDVEKLIEEKLRGLARFRITGRQKVLPYAPKKYKVRVDIMIL